jgi:hypothetical protein
MPHKVKFVFLIPRTPKRFRNESRDSLWTLCKTALMQQRSNNWTAIVLGDCEGEELDVKHFKCLPFDDFDKIDKLRSGLQYIESWSQKPKYLIRLDDDDIISPTILQYIEQRNEQFDCYTEARQAVIDVVFLKISYFKAAWFPNTVIHSYHHAIQKCGPKNEVLVLQHHDEFWHIYYARKRILLVNSRNQIYYRLLSPYSITSSASNTDNGNYWEQHLAYLNGYGPWIDLKKDFPYYISLNKIKFSYNGTHPKRSTKYWFLNTIKYAFNSFLNR